MRYFVQLAGKEHRVEVVDTADGKVVRDEQGSRAVSLTGSDASYRILIQGRVIDLSLSEHGKNLEVVGLGTTQQVSIVSERDRPAVATATSTPTTRRAITAQMPGKVLHVRVQADQQVHSGQGLLVMEAMKMENEIYADSDLRVVTVCVQTGDAVEMGAELLVVES
jgi:biotin carboxyl carrier protein